ncbi:XisI protein [Spirosoma panaciterrae]|uniref:XisI protein n=1 Tax=Spirosoma panaciterrae TaxID=496058 RepID=UPI0003683F33|nr:XisI protein [Spirosoma panaciterrae]
MDKVAKYRQIIEELLHEYASVKGSLTPGIKSQPIIDRPNNHYQLLRTGWHNNRFVYTILFHFDIIDSTVWIQQNNTDILIADELISRGVEKGDIILGFISEQARQHSKLITA